MCKIIKYCIAEILISVIQYIDVTTKKYLTKERKKTMNRNYGQRELEYFLREGIPFNMNGVVPFGTTVNPIIQQMKQDMTKSVMSLIKGKMGYTIRFSERGEDSRGGNNNFPKAYQWIKKYDKMFHLHVDNPQDIDDNLHMIKMTNKTFVVVLEKMAYAFVKTGNYVPDAKYGSNDMEIYITGKHAKPYFQELSEMTKATINDSVLQHYRVEGNESGSYYTYVSDMRTRNIDTLFYEDGVKENIIYHIKNFIDSEDMYKSRDLIYKTGILLTGEPGTGKTSLVTALATYFKWNLITINMEKFKYINVQELADSITADPTKYIILMEDIDIMLNSEENSKDQEYQENVHKLMQFLDGNISPSGVVIIATTNYPERLDRRVLRDGRFDINIYIDELTYKNIVTMAKSFDLNDTSVEDVIATLVEEAKEKDRAENKPLKTDDEYRENLKVNQAHIQTVILKSMKKQINLIPDDIESKMGESKVDYNKAPEKPVVENDDEDDDDLNIVFE